MINQATLQIILRYEPETGKLFWKRRPLEMFPDERACRAWNTRYAGQEAFTHISAAGYKTGRIFDKLYRAHRVIWTLMTGVVDFEDIDHRDGNRVNNVWSNLRQVSRGVNSKNSAMKSNNKTGHTGVCFDNARGRYLATIRSEGRTIYLGRFKKKEDAVAAYQTAKIKLGFTERHGLAA